MKKNKLSELGFHQVNNLIGEDKNQNEVRIPMKGAYWSIYRIMICEPVLQNWVWSSDP